MCYHVGLLNLADHHEVMIFQVGLKRINNEKKYIMKHTKRGGQHYGNVLWVIKSLIQVIKSLIQDYFSI